MVSRERILLFGMIGYFSQKKFWAQKSVQFESLFFDVAIAQRDAAGMKTYYVNTNTWGDPNWYIWLVIKLIINFPPPSAALFFDVPQKVSFVPTDK